MVLALHSDDRSADADARGDGLLLKVLHADRSYGTGYWTPSGSGTIEPQRL